MTNQTRLAAAALTGAALLTAGCSNSSQAAAPVPPPSVAASPSPSPSPSPAPSTPSEIAVAQAKQAAEKYFRVENQLAQDPNADIDTLKEVATGTGLSDGTAELRQLRDGGLRTVGDLRIDDMTVRKVDLSYDPKQYPPAIPTVQIDVCFNVADIKVLDKDGKTVPTPERQDTAVNAIGVVNYDWPNPNGWTLGYQNSRYQPCSVSAAG